MENYTYEFDIFQLPYFLYLYPRVLFFFSSFHVKNIRLNSAKKCGYNSRACTIQGRVLLEEIRYVKHVNIDFSVAKVNIFHILNFERKVFKTCVFANVNHTHDWIRRVSLCTAEKNLLNNKSLAFSFLDLLVNIE